MCKYSPFIDDLQQWIWATTHETAKKKSTVGESHCHGAKAISRKVVRPTIIEQRTSGITHSLGTVMVVKRVTTIFSPEPTVFFLPVQQGFWTVYSLLVRKPNEVINRLKPRRWRGCGLISICLFFHSTHMSNYCHEICSAIQAPEGRELLIWATLWPFPLALFVKYLQVLQFLCSGVPITGLTVSGQPIRTPLKYVLGDIHKTTFLGWKKLINVD